MIIAVNVFVSFNRISCLKNVFFRCDYFLVVRDCSNLVKGKRITFNPERGLNSLDSVFPSKFSRRPV